MTFSFYENNLANNKAQEKPIKAGKEMFKQVHKQYNNVFYVYTTNFLL